MKSETLRKAVSRLLREQGFRKVGNRMHVRSLVGPFWYWVDTGPLGPRTDIAPYAGLRHDAVEDLRADLLGLPRDPYTGTIGGNVGYVLGGDYLWWNPPTPPETVMETIVRALDALRPLATLDRLSEGLSIGGLRPPQWHFVAVSIALLSGHAAEARALLREGVAEDCRDEGEVCEQSRAFERRALAWMEEHGLS